MDKIKVLGYVRVSSNYQKLEGKSIKNQIYRIKKYCIDNDYELIDIIKDEGFSGMNKKRKGYNELIDRVKDVDNVIVYSLSRLGRKMKDVLLFMDNLKEKGCGFISIKENFNNNEIIGGLLLNIMGSINEFESKLMGERIRDVKRYKKEKNLVYSGNIIYGKYRDGDKLIDDDSELEIVNKIRELRKSGLSYFKISDRLNELGILSKKGKRWYGNSVRNVFRYYDENGE